MKKLDRKSSEAVTGRFLVVMFEIIAESKRTNGKYQTVKEFAASVKGNDSYIGQYTSPAKKNVTLEICCQLCKVHGIDANWLLLGIGEKYYKDGEGKFESINARIADLEKRVKNGTKTSQTVTTIT